MNNNLDVELSTFLKVYEPINLDYWKLYREEKVTKEALRYGRLKDAFNAININVEDDMINHLSVAYIDHLTTFNHLFDGTLDILNYLRDKYELHIITNGFEEAQERKMDNANIKSYFKTITNSEMVGVKKPNPKIFNFALDSAKASPTESVMIGDSLEADIEGAHSIGMETIYFDYRNLNNSNGYNRVTTLKSIETYL